MAKATTKEVPVEQTETADVIPIAPKLKKVCGTCSNWHRMSATVGQCKLSARAMPTMLVTTDLQSCSGWNELNQ